MWPCKEVSSNGSVLSYFPCSITAYPCWQTSPKFHTRRPGMQLVSSLEGVRRLRSGVVLSPWLECEEMQKTRRVSSSFYALEHLRSPAANGSPHTLVSHSRQPHVVTTELWGFNVRCMLIPGASEGETFPLVFFSSIVESSDTFHCV